MTDNKIDLLMKYWQATKITQAEFKRLTGVKKNFSSDGSSRQSSRKRKKETRT